MEEQNCSVGLVTEVNGTLAKIRFLRSSQCAHCGACLTAGESEMEVELLNPVGARVGDHVSVSLAPKRIVQASLLAYALPLGLLLIGVWVGSRISELYALLFGVAACGIGYLILRLVEKKGKKETFRPRITAVLNRQVDLPE
ncbi:MAG: SoxR reducing system RseC family protein [Clostridiaceae bacterium]